jgi:hypothetical protein
MSEIYGVGCLGQKKCLIIYSSRFGESTMSEPRKFRVFPSISFIYGCNFGTGKANFLNAMQDNCVTRNIYWQPKLRE